MDKDGYIDLLKQNLKIKKMREQLVLADLDDDKSDLKRSKAIAAGINAKHKDIVTIPDLKLEYDKLESKHELNEENENFSARSNDENIEYQAMINALDKLALDIAKKMHAIEVDNGIFNATRDTWAPKDDEEDDREQLNILDVFAVEINN